MEIINARNKKFKRECDIEEEEYPKCGYNQIMCNSSLGEQFVNIAEIFDEVAKQMRSDFEKARKAVNHPGLKGASFEETFRTFLREYLPRSLDVCTGVLVDSNGSVSRQLDVIISDSAKTPIFYRSGDIRVIPVECAYTVIEIKAYLNAKELDSIFQNMESVRNLKKIAYVKSAGAIIYSDNLYGREWEIWPINYYVFAYDSIKLTNLAKQINARHQDKNLPECSRIDTVCVLDKGVICNQLEDGKFNALPEPGSKLYISKTTRSLLLFYALTSRYFNQARLPNFRFTDYLRKMTF